ncbi:MAG: helix-turn-helix domain-containing protein [Zestosphaera sp.]
MESGTSGKEVFKRLYEGVSQVLDRVKFKYEAISFPVKHRERSIDVVAVSEEHGSLIIRLKNTMQVNKNEAQDLVKSSLALNALPLVVSEMPEVFDNVIVEREGVYIVGLKTLQNIYSGKDELVTLYRKGELYVRVDSESLSRRRSELGYSLTSLSRLLNISRKTLEYYERRGGNVTVEVAEKLAATLGDDVVKTITPTDLRREFVTKASREVVSEDVTTLKTNLRDLLKMGEGSIYEIRKSAPDYIIKDDETLMTVDVTSSRKYGVREILIKTHECVKFSTVTDVGVKIVADDSGKAKVIMDELSSLKRGNVEVIRV